MSDTGGHEPAKKKRKTQLKVCFVCPEIAFSRCVFCMDHQKAYDQAKYFLKKAKIESNEKIFVKELFQDRVALLQILKQIQDANPPACKKLTNIFEL